MTVERGEGGAARFSVIDTGPGVPADRRGAIFDSFEQGDGSHARRFEGAGLGLTISRELVRLMGGELTLADNPRRRVDLLLRGQRCRNAPRSSRPAPTRRAARSRGDARPHHRRFAVRGAGDRGATCGSRRQRRARRRPRLRPQGAERPAEARPRHCRLRAWSRGDQSPGCKPRARPGSGAASCCFRRSNGGPLGRRRLKASTAGWSSRSGRVRCSSG